MAKESAAKEAEKKTASNHKKNNKKADKVKENKTAQVFFEDGEDIRYYPNEKSYYNKNTQNGEVKNTSYLKQHFEEKKNEYEKKQKPAKVHDDDPYL